MSYSTKPITGNYATFAECLRDRAQEIDYRTGPIPGSVADKVAGLLRTAAAGLEASAGLLLALENLLAVEELTHDHQMIVEARAAVAKARGE